MLRHHKYLNSVLSFDKKHITTLRFISPTMKENFVLDAISDSFISEETEGGAQGALLIFSMRGETTTRYIGAREKQFA